MTSSDEFDSVRAEPDPLRRGWRATRLLESYQQRTAELARLRRAAIEEVHRERGMSYTEIAAALGLTKGRITQIRDSAPPAERVFFGVGPVSVGVPCREGTTDRARLLIAAEDAQAGEELERLLGSLALAVTRYQVQSGQAEPPAGDTVAVCGPKTAPLAAALLAQDPALAMVAEDGRWWVQDRHTAQRWGSPTDSTPARPADIAYVARHRRDGYVVVHIAGIHAVGSLGAAHYLASHLGELFSQTGDVSCSLVVRAGYDGLTITSSELAAGPFTW